MTNDPDRSGKKDVVPRYSDPFSALRAEMDNLFDSFMGGLPTFSGMFGTSGGRSFALTPHVDVRETDKESWSRPSFQGLTTRASRCRSRMAF
jgi:hypothetical protein